ncbi:MAG: hypothetical protein FD124_1419 [Alphaproteobacteria bacterium]|nr:MAG: hypothetical protein FD160_3357 [Caulobacteraceae bacterium]TPW07062.1 MAG: hypothetical protein FD124_1419 [Alphaproteobacteria bacterium]
MTLLELLVALSILGLVMGVTLSSVGPWLRESRRAQEDAAFWRDVTPARLTLTEFTTGAVDTGNPPNFDDHKATWTAYAPRLAPAPIAVTLDIESRPDGDRLVVRSDAVEGPATILLAHGPPLRFRTASATPFPRALVVEAQINGAWRALATAPFVASAPHVCAFDLISRSCR